MECTPRVSVRWPCRVAGQNSRRRKPAVALRYARTIHGNSYACQPPASAGGYCRGGTIWFDECLPRRKRSRRRAIENHPTDAQRPRSIARFARRGRVTPRIKTKASQGRRAGEHVHPTVVHGAESGPAGYVAVLVNDQCRIEAGNSGCVAVGIGSKSRPLVAAGEPVGPTPMDLGQ